MQYVVDAFQLFITAQVQHLPELSVNIQAAGRQQAGKTPNSVHDGRPLPAADAAGSAESTRPHQTRQQECCFGTGGGRGTERPTCSKAL
jgi:hypothetical protein